MSHNQRCYSLHQLSSGEEISCVPIYEQPSLKWLDHESNTYLKEPAFIPSEKSTEEHTQVIPDEIEIKPAEQVFKSEVGSCPEGISEPRFCILYFAINDPCVGSEASVHRVLTPFMKATYATEVYDWPNSDLYRGAKGYFNVWKPYVELSREFSLSQMWISAGSYSQNNLNTIEVGWQVCKNLYGDDSPHLFVYWTRDAYNSTGCYILACPGFVQTSSKWVVGGASVLAVSQTNGTQYELQVMVFLDQVKDVWWLLVNEEYVGYWPNSLFTTLKSGAHHVEFVNSQTGDRHTQTDMGSGEFAQAGRLTAAYIRSLQTVCYKPKLQL
ncbi:hypothetical protein R1sor_026474 [Riccia sorocarpa]|uniref:Neprosin PEP catalytic domain-containing protein n=1 Tax=Riccia sorocarpa TaxID=122646 RepID=A0ABD3GF56_9MARC